jgi:hypothetical protein
LSMTLTALASRAALAASIVACAWAATWSSTGQAQQAGQLAEPEAGQGKLPKCVHVRSEARFSGFGYDHLVEVENGCEKPASCSVSTDVNPQPQPVQLNVGEKQSVVTFRGSPASTFKPDVTCKLAS